MLTSPFSQLDNRNYNLSPQVKGNSSMSGMDSQITPRAGNSSTMSQMPEVMNGDLKTKKLQKIRSKIANMFDYDFTKAKMAE